MKDRFALITALQNYSPETSIENNFRSRFLSLLSHPRAFHRDHLPGHITGSAWIIDESKSYTLLTHHAKLNRWLQPGGHADGDEDVLNVAMREAEEETGLKSLRFATTNFFDIDIHTIPARKDFPEHDHYDVRFLIIADKSEPFTVTEESHDLQWVPLISLEKFTGDNESIIRMARKVAAM